MKAGFEPARIRRRRRRYAGSTPKAPRGPTPAGPKRIPLHLTPESLLRTRGRRQDADASRWRRAANPAPCRPGAAQRNSPSPRSCRQASNPLATRAHSALVSPRPRPLNVKLKRWWPMPGRWIAAACGPRSRRSSEAVARGGWLEWDNLP